MSKTNMDDAVRRIIIKPSEIWRYFQNNSEKLSNVMHMIAENDDWTVWITADEEEALIQVQYDGDVVREYVAYDESDIEEQYGFALDDIGFFPEEYDDPACGDPVCAYSGAFDDQVCDVDIAEREAEIDEIVTKFIIEMLGDEYIDTDDEAIEESTKTVKEVVCDILCKQYGMKLYRPMWLVGEDGNKFFAEYPYPHILAGEKQKSNS